MTALLQHQDCSETRPSAYLKQWVMCMWSLESICSKTSQSWRPVGCCQSLGADLSLCVCFSLKKKTPDTQTHTNKCRECKSSSHFRSRKILQFVSWDWLISRKWEKAFMSRIPRRQAVKTDTLTGHCELTRTLRKRKTSWIRARRHPGVLDFS